jgi:hypothetical protein
MLNGKFAVIDFWLLSVCLIIVTVVVGVQNVVLDRGRVLGQILNMMGSDEPLTVTLFRDLALDILMVVIGWQV